tara:strand:+ start:6209 stop:6673 length:465 start_codon:yes stop_codon:yes gene_type:complete
MTGKEYLANLNDIEASFVSELKNYAYKRGAILRSVKLRLYNGRDGNLKPLGNYSINTIKRKKKKGQKTSNVTLQDSGGWYNNLFLRWEAQELILDNKDTLLTSKLIDGDGKWFNGYGDGILELSGLEVELLDALVDEYMLSVQKKINKNIDLTF